MPATSFPERFSASTLRYGMPYQALDPRKREISRLMAAIRLRVKELRTRRGGTQRELARRAGVRHATIVSLERGASPRLDTLEKLARAFGVKVTQLLREER